VQTTCGANLYSADDELSPTVLKEQPQQLVASIWTLAPVEVWRCTLDPKIRWVVQISASYENSIFPRDAPRALNI
jgi:hypothetical protein